MRWLTICILTTALYGAGGVPKAIGHGADLSKFWTEDHRVLEQIYGKTSDIDIYGASLPSNVGHTVDLKKLASEKKERIVLKDDESEYYSNSYGNVVKEAIKHDKKKPVPSYNFISYTDFKPISHDSDPEAYNYLKHLDKHSEENLDHSFTAGGFKPYLNHVGGKSEEIDAYKSIQEILDAHEANKAKPSYKGMYEGKSKRKKPPRVSNDVIKPRCTSRRCRTRPTSSYRMRTRPYVRRIKQRVVRY